MTEAVTGAADAYARTKARRRRARRVMQTVTVVCALAAAGIGADELYAGGLQSFLERPPGVGATPADPQADSSPTPAPARNATAVGPTGGDHAAPAAP
jgi:hypothetical protein